MTTNMTNKTTDFIDGVDHINTCGRVNTALGKLLSHSERIKFIHPYFGPFESMEGFWYYMRSGGANGRGDDKLRYLSGRKAKDYGQMKPVIAYDYFQEDILAANYQKIVQNAELEKLFIDSTLPFDHYYLFGPNSVLIRPRGSDWLCAGFEEIRKAMQNGLIPDCWVNASNRYVKNIVDNPTTSLNNNS